MKVLQINQSDISGGAAIAAYRLHQGLLSQGVASKLLVGEAQLKSSFVATTPRRPWLEAQLYRINGRLGLNYINLIGSFDITKHSFYQEVDVINFHNLHSGYFNYLAIPKLVANKPAVLTLHDMWSFTGHCAYSYDCEKWKSGCGQCPYPQSYPGVHRDNTHLEWKLKSWIYERSQLTVVAPSLWLAKLAEKSILNHFAIHYIPNGLDVEAYQPIDPDQCRSLLGLERYKYVLLVLAASLTVERKGAGFILPVLKGLPKSLKQETVLLVMGNVNYDISTELGLAVVNMGWVESDRLKSIIYSAAHVFLLPTRADNLPVTLQESMACSRPMIAFNVGGVSELVRSGVTGYLVELEDTQGFKEAIVRLLEDLTMLEQMAQHCRKIALEEYSLNLQVSQYARLYQSLMLA